MLWGVINSLAIPVAVLPSPSNPAAASSPALIPCCPITRPILFHDPGMNHAPGFPRASLVSRGPVPLVAHCLNWSGVNWTAAPTGGVRVTGESAHTRNGSGVNAAVVAGWPPGSWVDGLDTGWLPGGEIVLEGAEGALPLPDAALMATGSAIR
jgi:hypothetical protein